MEKETIGIKSVGIFLPQEVRSIISPHGDAVSIRIAESDETPYEIGAKSIRNMVEKAKISLQDLEDQYFFFNEESYGDYLFQMHGRQIMDKVGVNRIISFNLIQGGNSSLMLMRLLMNHLRANDDSRFGVIGSPQSWGFHSQDRLLGDAVLGDGAASLLLERGYQKNRILSIVTKTISKYHDVIYNEVGGWKLPIADKPCKEGKFVYKVQNILHYKEIETQVFQILETVIEQALNKAKISWEEIERVVIHSPTQSHHNRFRKHFNLKEEQIIDSAKEYGFMCSAGILLSIDMLLNEENLKQGTKVLVPSFGVDGNWAAAVIEI